MSRTKNNKWVYIQCKSIGSFLYEADINPKWVTRIFSVKPCRSWSLCIKRKLSSKIFSYPLAITQYLLWRLLVWFMFYFFFLQFTMKVFHIFKVFHDVLANSIFSLNACNGSMRLRIERFLSKQPFVIKIFDWWSNDRKFFSSGKITLASMYDLIFFLLLYG